MSGEHVGGQLPYNGLSVPKSPVCAHLRRVTVRRGSSGKFSFFLRQNHDRQWEIEFPSLLLGLRNEKNRGRPGQSSV